MGGSAGGRFADLETSIWKIRNVPRENASDTPARYATQMRYFSSPT